MGRMISYCSKCNEEIFDNIPCSNGCENVEDIENVEEQTCTLRWEHDRENNEYEVLTECGYYTCSDECWTEWNFCPYCGKTFDNPNSQAPVELS